MSDATAARILDATFGAVADSGLARLTLEEVARRAGVSRQTLYRKYTSREGLLRALVLREEEWFIERVRAAARNHPSVEDAIAAGTTAALHAAREHPLLQRLLREEPGEILPLVVLGEGPVISVARPVVREILEQRLEARPEQVLQVADTCVRLLVSHVLDPGEGAPEVVGPLIARTIMRGALAADQAGS